MTRSAFMGWMSLAVAVLSVDPARADDDQGGGDWDCSALIGSWQVDARRSASTFFRPVNQTIHEDGTVWVISGTNVAPLGFTDRSGLTGECARTGSHTYQILLEELLYQDGYVAGRFLVVLDIDYDRRHDTYSGTGHFKITVFRMDALQAPTDPCTPATPLAKENRDLLRGGPYEFTCRQAADISLTATRLEADPFFED